MARSRLLRSFSVIQPLAFCLLLANAISDALIVHLLEYKTCLLKLNLSENECAVLRDSASDAQDLARMKKLVQPLMISLLEIKVVIEVLIPTTLSLFWGPWSDKFGRKPLIVLPFIGYTLYYLSLSIFSYNMHLEPAWYLICSGLLAIFGGRPTLLLTFVCFISDQANNQNKAWKLTLLDTAIYSGTLVGLFAGPYLFNTYGYHATFAIAASVCAFALIYASVFLVEAFQPVLSDKKWMLLFSTKMVKDMVKSVLIKRDNFDRRIVWNAIAGILCQAALMEGSAAIMFMFTGARLGWKISEFSTYAATNLLVFILGTVFVVKMGGYGNRLSNITVLFIAVTSEICGSLVKAFTTESWHLYLCTMVGMYSGATIPILRSIVADHVPRADLGKAFSMITTLETVIPVITTPSFLAIYEHTSKFYPATVWLFSCMFCILIYLNIALIKYQKKTTTLSIS